MTQAVVCLGLVMACSFSSLALIAFAGALPATGWEAPRLFAIQRDGTGLREIAKLPSVIGQVKFSPDGSKLVFSAVFYDLPRPCCFFIAGTPPTNEKIFLMNSDGSHQHANWRLFQRLQPIVYSRWPKDSIYGIRYIRRVLFVAFLSIKE